MLLFPIEQKEQLNLSFNAPKCWTIYATQYAQYRILNKNKEKIKILMRLIIVNNLFLKICACMGIIEQLQSNLIFCLNVTNCFSAAFKIYSKN